MVSKASSTSKASASKLFGVFGGTRPGLAFNARLRPGDPRLARLRQLQALSRPGARARGTNFHLAHPQTKPGMPAAAVEAPAFDHPKGELHTAQQLKQASAALAQHTWQMEAIATAYLQQLQNSRGEVATPLPNNEATEPGTLTPLQARLKDRNPGLSDADLEAAANLIEGMHHRGHHHRQHAQPHQKEHVAKFGSGADHTASSSTATGSAEKAASTGPSPHLNHRPQGPTHMA